MKFEEFRVKRMQDVGFNLVFDNEEEDFLGQRNLDSI